VQAAELARRAAHGLFVVLAAASLVFVAIRAVPGDPVDAILGEQALQVDRAALETCMRLDRALPVQYALFLADLARGTLGVLCDQPDRTVAAELADAVLPTVWLATASLLIAILLAVPLGASAALHRGRWPDRLALAVSTAGIALPVFCSGPLLLIAFSAALRALPGDPDAWVRASSLALPALAIGFALSARLLRVTRAAVLDVVAEAWVPAARARGLSARAVALRHVVRNALVPVVVAAGNQLGGLLAGAVVAERIFARPGLGSALLAAIEARNFALAQGCVVLMAVAAVGANLLADLATSALDPRTRDVR
jgi:ABC-type dipeptide/oligopeptide/nickel transport system permease component